MYLFAVDAGDRDIGEAVGDGTEGERGAFCQWVSLVDAVTSKSPVLACCVRFDHQLPESERVAYPQLLERYRDPLFVT